MVCKKCGKRLKEGEMFCTVCGYFNDPNDTSNYDDNKKENFTNDDEVDLLKEDEESVNDGIEIQAFSTDTTTDGTEAASGKIQRTKAASEDWFYKCHREDTAIYNSVK